MYIPQTDNDTLIEQITKLAPRAGETMAIYLAEHDMETDILQLIASLNAQEVTFFGGIFPGLIYGAEKKMTGALVHKFPCLSPPIVFQNLSSKAYSYSGFSSIPFTNSNAPVIALVDGLTSNISYFIDYLNDHLGEKALFIGGGAGSLTLKQSPALFSKEGFFEDAAIICPLDYQAVVGVRHGWQQLHGPVVATRTEGTIIHELNWQPAFEVYQEVVEKDSGQRLTREGFFDIAKSYPFGIYRENKEDIVRDPIAVGEAGELICVGEVPSHTVLNILKGNKEHLLNAANHAMLDCGADQRPDAKQVFLVDCISRTLFLEDSFVKELEAVNKPLEASSKKVPLHGILSLGEISSPDRGILEFLNKTIVASLFY
jgi:hypothetical protein